MDGIDLPLLGRVALATLGAYVVVVVMLRISGKRTLSRMDPFDFVIATALGSTVAQTALATGVTFAMGLIAMAALIGLQWLVTYLTMRSHVLRRLVKPEPRLLFYRGEFLTGAMRREHVPELEILAAARASGFASLDDVEAVVLEADSHFSVLRKSDHGDSALWNVCR